ncbi:hypothetical protein BUL40_06225 [Croceivirga radicis]|uniref:Fibronectin type-III domain-containing protein n=1 Tax=Croceivirga radicis TaxID=1929488 RepID=A0A1V6LTB6_9FLAO|nr:hypothetical protein [Croceivirga radicis]OQD43424.1 hypothetical protein BUL40_06225 [Croceivirga radicis]
MYSKLLTYLILPIILGFSQLTISQELIVTANPAVKVIARSLEDRVLLRWAVDQPYAWKKANESGFLIERITIESNGLALDNGPRIVLTTQPLKPAPLEAWENLATQNQNAAILAQALYGQSFNATPPGNSTMTMVYTINEELEQRHTFALLAAEQSWDAAKLAGWAFEDTSIIKGEKYIYSVKVAPTDEEAIKIDKSAVVAGTPFYEALPKPIELSAVFGDGVANVTWDFNLLKHIYSSYNLERSVNGNPFEKVNTSPIFNAQQGADGQSAALFYQDTITNGKAYKYRVKGFTAFGEVGPYSEEVGGMPKERLAFTPRISRKKMIDPNTVELLWEFDEKGNEAIKSFYLSRSNKDNGVYTKVVENIPVNQRKITYKGLKAINYFRITAVGKNGIESESYSSMVQPIDSTPPAPPVNITAKIDTTGVVTLEWNRNTEVDLAGYRVYRNTSKTAEFSMVSPALIKDNRFTDTITIKTLNTKMYYKVTAEDQRYNTSEFSKVFALNIPDVLPPSPPVIKSFANNAEGVAITWVPSSSKDVKAHILFKKETQSKEWLQLKVLESDTTFMDENTVAGTFAYTVIAKDSTGLESTPAKPIIVKRKGQTNTEKAMNLTAVPNRELRFIAIQWRIKNEDISEYRLYKSVNSGPLRLYRTLDKESKGINDVDISVNTEYGYGIQGVTRTGVITPIKKIQVKY